MMLNMRCERSPTFFICLLLLAFLLLAFLLELRLLAPFLELCTYRHTEDATVCGVCVCMRVSVSVCVVCVCVCL